METEDGLKYWKKILGEQTKNHRVKSEDLRKGGFILHEENDFGFNPGDFFALYLSKIDCDAKYLFCTSFKEMKKFKLHQNPATWYSKNKCGKNTVAKAMPAIAECAGISRRITNQNSNLWRMEASLQLAPAHPKLEKSQLTNQK